MTRALADRDMGAVLRLYRRWTGASQSDVSAATGLAQPHVSALEQRRRKVTALEVFERIADGLDIPRGRLGLAERVSGGTAGDLRVAAGQQEWLGLRRGLAGQRPELTQVVSRLYPESVRLGGTGILAPAGWRLPTPIDLASVRLEWREDVPAPRVAGGEAETRPLRPLSRADRRYSRLSRAVKDLDRPRLFDNRLCYRLLGVHDGLSLSLGPMCYFDMIDVGEALALEAARAAVDPTGRLHSEQVTWDRLPFRRLLRDPFDLAAYPLMLSISTLTVRRSEAGATFYLLRRDPAKVAIAGGMLSVVPTGVFQPASVLPTPRSPDFDLWRNVMREYSEELLGNPEHDGDGAPVDYERDEPFRTLDAGRRAGDVRVSCLGVGVDALNYVGDVLTVAVFEAGFFDRVFDGLVDQNDEGDVAEAFALDERTVRELLAGGTLAPSGAACLHLAWHHWVAGMLGE
jgi:hypothetical protein